MEGSVRELLKIPENEEKISENVFIVGMTACFIFVFKTKKGHPRCPF